MRLNIEEAGENLMKDQSVSDKLAAVAVALLLILTAWGNAWAMFVVAVLGLLAGLLFFRKELAKGGALAATVGFVVAIVIVLIMRLR